MTALGVTQPLDNWLTMIMMSICDIQQTHFDVSLSPERKRLQNGGMDKVGLVHQLKNKQTQIAAGVLVAEYIRFDSIAYTNRVGTVCALSHN